MRTTIYLCAALLGLALSSPAQTPIDSPPQTPIAYTDGPAFPITTDTNSTLDLDRDGVADFVFGAVFVAPDSGTNVTLVTNSPTGGVTGDFFVTSLNFNGISNSVLCSNGQVVIMPAGTPIGNFTPSNTVWNTSATGASLAFLGITFGSPPVSTWYGPLAAPPQEGYFGVSFNNQDGLHYGWVHAKLQTNDSASTTGPIILDWAYETRPYTALIAGATNQTATVEWHTLEIPTIPPTEFPVPTSLVLSPATPDIASRISFISPANGLSYLNSIAAEAEYGAPLISVDQTNRSITVIFTPPLDEAIPQIAIPADGLDGQFGPLAAGIWTFQVLTNSYTFTVSAQILTNSPPVSVPIPPLAITPAGNQIVISWPTAATNYVLQTATSPASGNWNNVTNGITTNAGSFIFSNIIGNQSSAFYRLKQQ